MEEKQVEAHLRTLDYKKPSPNSIITGKLATNWEGPYRIVDVIREGTCTFATIE
ncbi:hypothetical protein BHM03_00015838 [Ensete ventricosum]|nr:hypothetical protein BHM03_00015838 [Ensete ventricosum]